jgi:hypothetical protein
MRTYPFILFLLLNFLVLSCDDGIQGSLNENLPPNTSLTVNEINLPEGERLTSQVDISWWGDDPDGYIVGYEYYIGEVSNVSDEDWIFTEQTDSTFVLPIPQGDIDANVQFNIRAIDNNGERDPEPPSLTFPIRNTAPETSFISNETPPDTTYRIVSFGFEAEDPDGNSNLNRIEIALNDTSSAGSWKELSLDVDFITLRIDDNSPDPIADVLLGRSAVESDIQFESVNVNGENEFFVRAFDNAEAVSSSSSFSWYVKQQTSKILLLNDYFGFNTEERGELHLSILDSIGISNVDYIDISDGQALGGTRVPLTNAFPDRSLAQPTINLMLAEWDYIYWISDDLDRNIGYALELTEEFFNQGGKMFINIPIEYLGDRNSLFQFLPFQGVELASYSEPGRSPEFRIRSCSEVKLIGNSDYTPNLRMDANILPAYPIIPFSESINLFEAEFSLLLANPRGNAEYNGNSVVSTMNPDQSIVYFGFDLDDLATSQGDCSDPDTGEDLPPSDLPGLIEFLTIETLGFEQ